MPPLFYSALSPRVLLLDRGGNVLIKSPSLSHEPDGPDNRALGPCPPSFGDRDRRMVAELLAEAARDGGSDVSRAWTSDTEGYMLEWSAVGLALPGEGIEHVLLTGVDRVEDPAFAPDYARKRPADLLIETRFPMWVLDRRTCRLMTANSAALALFGRDRAALRSLRLHHLVRRNEIMDALETLVSVRRGVETRDYWRLSRANGEALDVEVQLLPVDAGGTPACAVLAREQKPH
jgi:hypothetical protein